MTRPTCRYEAQRNSGRGQCKVRFCYYVLQLLLLLPWRVVVRDTKYLVSWLKLLYVSANRLRLIAKLALPLPLAEINRKP